LRRPIAEKLTKLLLVVTDFVLLDKADEIRRRVSRQRRLAEVRVGGEEIFRPAVQVREIATPAAGDQDLLANAIGVLKHRDPAATLTGFDGAHQAGCASAKNNYVEGLVDQVISFKCQAFQVKTEIADWKN